MNNWKVPAVILPIVSFGGFFLLDNLDKSGYLLSDTLIYSWFILIAVPVIWLFVLSWKRVKNKSFMSNGLIENWKVPAIILVLLIIAMAFRWSTVSSQTTSRATIKHKQDNWNGAVYQQYYPTSGVYNEKLVRYPPSSIRSQDLTILWGVTLTGSILWLLFAVSRTKKVEIDKEIEGKVRG